MFLTTQKLLKRSNVILHKTWQRAVLNKLCCSFLLSSSGQTSSSRISSLLDDESVADAATGTVTAGTTADPATSGPWLEGVVGGGGVGPADTAGLG